MKLILVSMVRNESKIIERCLKSVEGIVDAFSVCDTGSTDNTVELATEFVKTRKGIVFGCEWKDFGHNRTLSFQGAQSYVRDQLKWDLKDTYGLLLDADMIFVPNKLREQTLTEIGYTVIQSAGNLEYPNCRLIRMDYDWKCRGVTHEYWDGVTTPLGKDICYIDDQNDGGCKSDKFERDARLLEKGLAEEPTNVRYMFYLAQTYHSLGRWKDAIDMYTKRIDAGGWDEEQWYSMYMIGQSYLQLDDPIQFESWMLRAYKFRPQRAENLYKLARHFREKGDQWKAYEYVRKGRAISLPNDSLFLEKNIYNGLFDYESTILKYYVSSNRKEGLRESVRYLLDKKENLNNVYTNMKFYIEPIDFTTLRNHPVLRDVCGHDYHPTSVSIFSHKGEEYHNVRFVNYSINHKDGSYMMKDDGKYADNHKVRTQNVCYQDSKWIQMKDESVTLERKDSHIVGLEDVRVYTNGAGTLSFTATTKEYSEKIRILQGDYDVKGTYSNCVVIDSPLDAECEKNWIAVNNTDDVIYSWNPLRVGKRNGNQLKFHTEHPTSWLFQHLRGSAVAHNYNGEIWCLVHYVEYCTPRKYYHCFVILDPVTYKPLRMSLPFVFRTQSIEYCIGFKKENEKITYIASFMDDNPCIVESTTDALEWLDI